MKIKLIKCGFLRNFVRFPSEAIREIASQCKEGSFQKKANQEIFMFPDETWEKPRGVF